MSASPTEKLHCVIFNFIRSFVHEQKLNKEIVNICLYIFGEVHENEMYSVSQKNLTFTINDITSLIHIY